MMQKYADAFSSVYLSVYPYVKFVYIPIMLN